jgi:hypothetical protein
MRENPRLLTHPEISVEMVRAYVLALQEQRHSLRDLAEQIDLNHSTLHNFVTGTDPQPRIRRKLVEWYVWHTGGEGSGAENAAAALKLLVGLLPPEAQPGAREEFVAGMERTFRESGRDVPGWVQALREGR